MQTLKIEIPKGFEVASFDEKTGEIKFKEKPKSVTERIKTVADLLADHKVTQHDFDHSCRGLTEDEINYRLLKMLTNSLNEGWKPDWNNHNENKYYAWFEMGGSSGFRFSDCVGWHSGSDVGSRLCFKTYELAQHASKHFTDVYKKFMVI